MDRILIIDDHAIVRKGMRMLISEHIEAEIDTVPDGETAIKKVKEESYNLVILDINIPDMDCDVLVSAIQGLKPKQNILIFSMNDERLFAMHYIKLGAKGFVSKNALEEDIIYAIKQVIKGKKFVNPELVDAIDSNDNPFQRLSERELRVTHHLLKGKNILEISQTMNLHTSTISTYRTRIFEKLNISNLVELTELSRIHHFL